MWPELETLARVALAAALGGVIGLEREVKERPAGLRTHMLVGAGAALFVSLGPATIEAYGGLPGELRSDPLRILEAVVTGVSFIGAGTILLRRGENHLEGITTAGSILVTAAIGTAVAIGEVVLAVGTCALVLVILVVLARFERWLQRRSDKSR